MQLSPRVQMTNNCEGEHFGGDRGRGRGRGRGV
jgi:hypothetical protein